MKQRTNHGNVTFGLTIFLSAFLLFWVQLLLGKYILPWFGGTPAVWTTCMLFFQVLLLGGYIYAHVLNTSRLTARAQGIFHSVLLGASLIVLACGAWMWSSPLTPGANWKPHGSAHPVRQIIALLSVSAGLPYFTLSATSPLLQAWFSRVRAGGSPYRLYALSNLGSFLALLAFPSLLEPGLTLQLQARVWFAAFFIFAIGCGYCALHSGTRETIEASLNTSTPSVEESEPLAPTKGRYLLWLGLSTCASIVFLATTNQICQDIGVVPLLWILPLGLYLLTFVICFEHERWYARRWFHPLFALAIFGASFVLCGGAMSNFLIQIAIYTFALFIVCMVCNGELARSKPHSRYLTPFYLTVATGGAAGGLFVALLAPHLFKGFWEYQFGLWMSALLLLIVLVRDKQSWLYQSRVGSPIVVFGIVALLPESVALATGQSIKSTSYISSGIVLFLIVFVLSNRKQSASNKAREQAAPVICGASLLVLAGILGLTAFEQSQTAVAVSRNFYGVLAVRQQHPDEPEWAAESLVHGRILHGYQFHEEMKRREPTSYYGRNSGGGLVIAGSAARTASENRGARIGVVGLGIGTLAAYGKTGDTIRFYEINPDVVRIASDAKYFTFLSDCRARVEVISGDARLSMERELERNEAQDFDVLVVDAFSGDAIPVHLLTQEAFEIYVRELRKPSGILAIHISNTYLDLKPVIVPAAKHAGLQVAWVHSNGAGRVTKVADWMLLSQAGDFPGVQSAPSGSVTRNPEVPAIRPWTDEYSNLLQILNH